MSNASRTSAKTLSFDRGVRYLLDTNVVSETRKIRADARVMSFLSAIDESSLFISALTIGELHRGIAVKRRGAPEDSALLAVWVDAVAFNFVDRILPVDVAVARRWGEFSSDRSRSVVDTLIAATAQLHGMTLVTRNVRDVSGLGVPILDPWTA